MIVKKLLLLSLALVVVSCGSNQDFYSERATGPENQSESSDQESVDYSETDELDIEGKSLAKYDKSFDQLNEMEKQEVLDSAAEQWQAENQQSLSLWTSYQYVSSSSSSYSGLIDWGKSYARSQCSSYRGYKIGWPYIYRSGGTWYGSMYYRCTIKKR